MKKKKKQSMYFIIFMLLVITYVIYNGVNESYSFNTTSNITGDKLLKISYLDVGQGDSILIEDNKNNMLIDAGNNDDGDKLVKYFKGNDIVRFDYVVGTHPHEDHIGGLDDVINNFEVENIYMPDVITTTKTFEDLLKAIDNKNLSITVPKIGDTFKLGESTIEVIYLDNDSSDLNDCSIVLKLTYYNNTFLFMGDATSKVETNLLNSNIEADVLKVGHHGSRYSNNVNFLKKVNPKYAVISVGKNNVYNHPANSTIDKLNKNNIKIYRTDKMGSIIITSNGKDISIKTIETDTNGG